MGRGRPRKNPIVNNENGDLVVAPAAPKPTLEDKVAALEAQADGGDEAIAAAMVTVRAFVEKYTESKAAFKLAERRLKNLIKGLLN